MLNAGHLSGILILKIYFKKIYTNPVVFFGEKMIYY